MLNSAVAAGTPAREESPYRHRFAPRPRKDSLAQLLTRSLAGVALVALLASCNTINGVVHPNKAAQEKHVAQLQQLQLSVMRYADAYVGTSVEAVSTLQRQLTSGEDLLLLQNWKVAQATSAYTIASGPNAVTNALDMVVLATLSRMVVQDAWVTQNLGARAKPIQATYVKLEASAWDLVRTTLTPQQITRLHEVIDTWRAEHPNVRQVAYIHFADFASSVGAPGPGEVNSSGGLFAIIGIDPFSGLDPAVQEIAQTRLLAERTIYYAQRAPNLLDMQVERLGYQFAVMPDTKALMADVGQVSGLAGASTGLVNNLPQLIDQQREAIFKQLLQTLNQSNATLGSLAENVRATLQAGTATANALDATVKSVQQLVGQFTSQPQTPPTSPPGPPFDINQYTAALEQATITARALNDLALHADGTSGALKVVVQDAESRVNGLVNHVFMLLVVLVFAIAAAVLMVLVGYRRLARPRVAT
jgi:hypothetical protein